MYFSASRLLLLIFIAIVLGINLAFLVNTWSSGSILNPLLNISGLTILGLIVILFQWYQNRKNRTATTKSSEV